MAKTYPGRHTAEAGGSSLPDSFSIQLSRKTAAAALGRQEEWEEPKGRSESARSATPDFTS